MLEKDKLKKELMLDAKGIGILEGAAKLFIDRAVNDAEKSLKSKKIITDGDLERAISKELRKYNADLAYVYKNRGKII